MQVRITGDRDGLDAEITSGAEHAARNFGAIRDEDAANG
jgi:hypothetical protein